MKDIWEIYLNIIYVHHFSSIYPTKVQLVELYDFRSHLISKKVVFYMRIPLSGPSTFWFMAKANRALDDVPFKLFLAKNKK